MNVRDICTYVFAGMFAFFILAAGSIPVLNTTHAINTPTATVAHAQEDTTYTFMQNVNLPGFGGESDTINITEQSLAEFVNTLIQIAIGFAILLAIIMVIAAGVEYMMSGSVTDKTNAQEQIGKALGGLFLALSAVVILQTINPNLIELNALQEINVEGDEIDTPDFGGLVDFNPDGPGLFYCFNHDSWGANEHACTEDIDSCQDAKSVDDNSYSDCQGYLITEGNYTEFTSKENDYCFAYSGTDGETHTNCYESESNCTDSPRFSESLTGDECQSPEDIESELSGLSTIVYDQQLESFVLEGSYPEDDVRSNLTGGGVDINKDPCMSVASSSCTNVGGFNNTVQDKLLDWKNGGLCNSSQCPITVTGGTSWWFHGNQKKDPDELSGTCHVPQDLEAKVGCTNAVDLRFNDQIDTVIENQTGIESVGDSACWDDNDGWSNGNFWLKESDHWHVVIRKSEC